MQTQFKCEPILLLLSCDFVLVGLPRPARCKRISERRFQLLLPKASGNSKIQTVNFCNALVEHEHGIFRFIQSYPAPGPLFDVFQADDWFKPLTGDIKADNFSFGKSPRRLLIGILDPNQGVTGKGLWDLQQHGIDVELFPPELARRIRALNQDFIRIQQTLGIQFGNIESGQTIRTWDKNGTFEIRGSCLNTPGENVFVFTGIGGQWYPQFNPLRMTGDGKWASKIHFGAYGPHTVCIVKATDLGVNLVRYYRKIVSLNHERGRIAKEFFQKTKIDGSHIVKSLAMKYPGIEMGYLPKGIEVQAMVEIEVERPPATGVDITQIA
jgi:hypothetical protein